MLVFNDIRTFLRQQKKATSSVGGAFERKDKRQCHRSVQTYTQLGDIRSEISTVKGKCKEIYDFCPSEIHSLHFAFYRSIV